MNEVLKQEVLQLIRTNDVAEAYLRLIPIVEEDDEAAELLLMMLMPRTAISTRGPSANLRRRSG